MPDLSGPASAGSSCSPLRRRHCRGTAGRVLGIDPAASALAEVAGGSVWLLPVPFVAVGLAMLALTSDMRRHPVFLPLVVAGLVLTLGQGFVIGLRGPVLTEIVELFPAAASGQQGFGLGRFLVPARDAESHLRRDGRTWVLSWRNASPPLPSF